MRTVGVIAFLGTPCLLAPEKGSKLASEIKRQLQAEHSVRVDFDGYEFLSSAFLNHAFGQICIDQNMETSVFHESILIVNMTEDDMEELELALDNAQTRRVLINRGHNPDQYYSSRLPV